MPYCSFCAGLMEPGQTQCPRCGRGASVAVIPTGRPNSVTIAASLLVVAFLLSTLSLAGFLFTPNIIARLPAFYWIRTFGFWIAWIVFLACFWMRQGWARFAIAALIVWNIGNIGLSLTRANPIAIIMPLIVAAVRIPSLFMMFKSDANAWFKNE